MNIPLLPRYLIYFFITLVVLVSGSCKSKKSATKQNQYYPAPPIKDEWPVIEQEPDNTQKAEIDIKFEIALIMPFELKANLRTGGEEISDPQILKSSLPAMHFFEGALMAVDSIASEHRSVSVRAFDAPSDSMGLHRIINNPSFGKPGLVIATLPNSLIGTAAAIAERRNLNIIFNNAASTEFLKNSPHAAVAYTSTISQCKEMVNYMMQTNMNENVILVYRTIRREDELAGAFRDQIMFNNSAFTFKDFNATKNEVTDLIKYINKDKKNLVFVVSSDEAFVSPIISLLSEQQAIDSSVVSVAGLPTWQQFESIDFMSFSNLNYYIFENNYINYDDPGNRLFRRRFIQRYSSDPLPSAFNGFDLVYGIGRNIQSGTPSLSEMINSCFKNTKNKFRFVQSDSGGYENMNITILEIKNYSLMPVNTEK